MSRTPRRTTADVSTRGAVVRRLAGVVALVPALMMVPAGEAAAVELDAGDILIVDSSTFAGGSGGVIQVDPVTGQQAAVSSGGGFSFPRGVALEADGAILVVDSRTADFQGAVFRVDPVTGAQTTVSSRGSFLEPTGVAVEADGAILVVDSEAFDSGALFRVDPVTGVQTTLSSGGSFVDPVGVAIEADGDILVVDVTGADGTGAVFRVDPMTGAQTTVTAGSFDDPVGVAVEADGDILVVDEDLAVVFRVDPVTGARAVLSSGGSLDVPEDVVVEADGDIVVADRGPFGVQGAVIRLDPVTGAQTTVSSAGLFEAPVGVAIVPNRAPTATGDAYTTAEDTALTVPAPGVLGNDIDTDGDALSATRASGPANGTLVLNPDGSFAYTPNANFAGTATFSYLAGDGALASAAATVTITVTAVDDPPAAGDDAYTTAEDTALTVPAPGLLGNDSDPDGDPLTAVVASGPASGTLTVNADGSFGYVPNANFSGADSFTYSAVGGGVGSVPATVRLTVTAVNDAPVAVPDAYQHNILGALLPLAVPAPGVLANDSDVDGDAVTATLVSRPRHGTLTLRADGSFSYRPNLLFVGTDTFTYAAQDAGGARSAPTTVSVRVRLL